MEMNPPLGVGGCHEGLAFPLTHEPQDFAAGCWLGLPLLHTCVPHSPCCYQVCAGPGTHTHRADFSECPAGCRDQHTHRLTPTLPSGSGMSAGGVRYPHKAARRVLGLSGTPTRQQDECWGCQVPPHGSGMSAGAIRYPPSDSGMSAGSVRYPHKAAGRFLGCQVPPIRQRDECWGVRNPHKTAG